jgi:hypothetical protein
LLFLRPENVGKQLIQHRIAAFQPAGSFHFAVEDNRPDLSNCEMFRRFINTKVTETEESKPRFVALFSIPTDVAQTTSGRAVIRRVKIAVFVQNLYR